MTVYVPDCLAVMVRDVAPFDHRYVAKPLPASSIVLSPSQNTAGHNGVMEGVGLGNIVTVTAGDVALQLN